MPDKGKESMQHQEVREIIAEVLLEQKRLHDENLDDTVLKTIATILTSFGIEEEDRKELRADFQHLRRWRRPFLETQRAIPADCDGESGFWPSGK